MVLGLSIVLMPVSQEGIVIRRHLAQPTRDLLRLRRDFMLSKTFRRRVDGILSGAAYACIILVIGIMENGPMPDDLLLRAFFGLVLGVCAKPALDGAIIELGAATPPKLARFHLGWVMGSMWGFAMVLAFWPLSPAQLIVWILGGVFFGTVMAKLHKPVPQEPERRALYDLNKEVFAGWHPLWRIFPGVFLVAAFTAIAFLNDGQDANNANLMLGLSAALLNNNAPYTLTHRGLKTLHMIAGLAAIFAGYMAL